MSQAVKVQLLLKPNACPPVRGQVHSMTAGSNPDARNAASYSKQFALVSHQLRVNVNCRHAGGN